jgi:hypothetical protein
MNHIHTSTFLSTHSNQLLITYPAFLVGGPYGMVFKHLHDCFQPKDFAFGFL